MEAQPRCPYSLVYLPGGTPRAIIYSTISSMPHGAKVERDVLTSAPWVEAPQEGVLDRVRMPPSTSPKPWRLLVNNLAPDEAAGKAVNFMHEGRWRRVLCKGGDVADMSVGGCRWYWQRTPWAVAVELRVAVGT